jgi:hypothetical protein
MKCDGYLIINGDSGARFTIWCDLDKDHTGSHIYYGDNYKIVFLTKDRCLDNLLAGVSITESVKEICKRKLLIENLAEDIF